MKFRSYKISKEWAKSVTFAEFKKNAIVKQLSPEVQQSEYEKLTGKKVKTKRKEDKE